MKWFKRANPNQKSTRVVAGVFMPTSSIEFRQHPGRAAEAAKLLRTPALAEMLTVVALESPIKANCYSAGQWSGNSGDMALIEAGYQLALRRLWDLALPVGQDLEVPMTFPDPYNPQQKGPGDGRSTSSSTVEFDNYPESDAATW